jgi:hypothetical protein
MPAHSLTHTQSAAVAVVVGHSLRSCAFLAVRTGSSQCRRSSFRGIQQWQQRLLLSQLLSSDTHIHAHAHTQRQLPISVNHSIIQAITESFFCVVFHAHGFGFHGACDSINGIGKQRARTLNI